MLRTYPSCQICAAFCNASRTTPESPSPAQLPRPALHPAQQCPRIQKELAAYRAPEAEEALKQKGTRIWSAAAREEAIAYGPNWRTLVLQDRSRWSEENAALFPETVRIVKESGCPSVEVFFARQAPGSGIKPHSDGCNFILTSHLGLDVPEGQCWLKARGRGGGGPTRCGGVRSRALQPRDANAAARAQRWPAALAQPPPPSPAQRPPGGQREASVDEREGHDL